MTKEVQKNTQVTLYVKNVDLEDKEKGDEIAKTQGLNSLQDAIRQFIKLYVQNRVKFSMEVAASVEEYLDGDYKSLDFNKDIHEQLMSD